MTGVWILFILIVFLYIIYRLLSSWLLPWMVKKSTVHFIARFLTQNPGFVNLVLSPKYKNIDTKITTRYKRPDINLYIIIQTNNFDKSDL